MSDLAKFLQQAGFQRVALTSNGVGHFQTEGSLAGQHLSVLIDTGAASTVIDLALAREQGWELTKLDRQGRGAAGSSLEVYHLQNATLSLGTVSAQPKALLALDLSHVNNALVLKGGTAIHAILGSDSFENQAAVIDYEGQALYLKGEPEPARVLATVGNRIVPNLLVRDMAESIKFYTEDLGFRLVASYPSKEPCWAEVMRDGVSLMLHNQAPKGTPAEPIMSGTLYLYPNDVRALAAQWEGRVAFAWGPEIMPHGTREFGVRDPDGYCLAFAEAADH